MPQSAHLSLPRPLRWGCSALVIIVVAGGFVLYQIYAGSASRSKNVLAFLRDPAGHAGWTVQANTRCGSAPFQFPTTGFIGYLWDDSFKIGSRHQGLDIFAGTEINQTPVYAAYDGYLTRQADWKSSVIIRIPSDPLSPGRQIWTYYTHMASPEGQSFIAAEFPPGASEKFVKAGTLLGYQGNFSGDPSNPVGVHLHFSIVLDDAAAHGVRAASFRNELDIRNTLDPSPYLGLALNARQNHGEIPVCP